VLITIPIVLQSALLQHVRRAIYQASLWSVSLRSPPAIPTPEDHGWEKTATGWAPVWTRLPEAAIACRELLRCGCKKLPQCTRKCKCHEAGLPCTTLCGCGGNCVYWTMFESENECENWRCAIVLFWKYCFKMFELLCPYTHIHSQITWL